MTIILFLLLVSLTLGAGGLGFFLWSLRSGQYDDFWSSYDFRFVRRIRDDSCSYSNVSPCGIVGISIQISILEKNKY